MGILDPSGNNYPVTRPSKPRKLSGGWANIVRCICYGIVLSAVLTSHDPETFFFFPALEEDIPLPVEEDDWTAPASSWRAPPQQIHSTFSTGRALLRDEEILGDISPFGLLTLIGVLLRHVCVTESLMLSIKLEKSAYSARGFEASLKKWEEKWQSHPQSSHLPSSHHGPLAADAISLLNSAYYHLHGSRQLRQMKRVFMSGPADSWPSDGSAFLNAAQLPGLNSTLVRAAKSLRLYARLGIQNLKKTASTTFSCFSLISAYESGRNTRGLVLGCGG